MNAANVRRLARLLVFLVTAPTACPGLPLAAESARPNIIFVLADDLGVGNVGCYGADHYRTPHIDALAAGGLRFSHAYTAPLCGPSRALIMTGRYAFRTGATNQDATGRMRPDEETMIPGYLAPAGYASSCVGKWGQLPLGPADFGFDDSFTFRGSGVYWKTGTKSDTYLVNGAEKSLGDGEYMPDLMHAHVVRFIERHRDRPFFVYYPLSHVHFTEPVVAAADDDDASRGARGRLAAALAALDPAGGILDDGDGSGRHASKVRKEKNLKTAP